MTSYIPPEQLPPAERREFLIYYARVMLREARARRGQRGIEWMLRGAARARREALAIDLRPAQAELFA
jgi:hypothetical protein